MKKSSSANGRGRTSSSGRKTSQTSNGRSSNSSSSNSRSSNKSSRSSTSSRSSSGGRSTVASRSSSSRTTTRGNSSNGRSGGSRSTSVRGSSRLKQQPASNFTDDLQKVLMNGLKDVFYAEKLLAKTLNKMSKAAENEKLKKAFDTHKQETEEQIDRLEQVFSILGTRASGRKCPAMDGLVEEGLEAIKEFEKGPARDAALIMAAQKAEHYEIATYGSLRTFAEILGYAEVSQILDDILDQESNTDEILTSVAQTTNQHAALISEGEEVEDEKWKRLSTF